jgi:hypothetical protein
MKKFSLLSNSIELTNTFGKTNIYRIRIQEDPKGKIQEHGSERKN